MEATDAPSTSKVLIQCIDPNDLYDSLESRLSARSPLRNLHWKSASRPLRSIPSLNISLVREHKSTAPQSNPRRHQIPGLRETPYVKVYLVRCDDKETYKEKVRKQIRQWVKTQISAGDGKSSSKSQEAHDASEWLILHVVLPNTPAASQPKTSKHVSLDTTESTDSVNSKSKWTGKSSATIFDRLRADFNSSKYPINHVAQVRLLDPADKSTPLTPAELEEQWLDLIETLKACILRSFDSRVSQYELDIRERDGQRALPGWNFCTFFVLKEGLAKGFENVGLLDDALAVYDELSLGLDTLVQEQADQGDHDDGGALLRFSRESKSLLRKALDSPNPVDVPDDAGDSIDLPQMLHAESSTFPFDGDRKNYRELILSNEVSALDLRIYLFARQFEILTRQMQPTAVRKGPDLDVLATIIERAVQFINLAARSLRLELYSAWGGQEGLSSRELRSQKMVTGNIVATWEWRAIMQILSRVLPFANADSEYGTSTVFLDKVELARNPDSFPTERAAEQSLKMARLSLAANLRAPLPDPPHELVKRNSITPDPSTLAHLNLARPGSERLSLWVSKLAMMARHVVENLEAARTWSDELKQVLSDRPRRESSEDARHGIHANGSNPGSDDGVGEKQQEDDQGDWWAGLESKPLTAAVSSKPTFFRLYALLTVFAFRMVRTTSNTTSVNRSLTDLAAMEYSQRNYDVASQYLHRILGALPRVSYRSIDQILLRIYADCLKHTNNPSEYARCLISCLQCCGQNMDRLQSHTVHTANQSYMDELFGVAPSLVLTTLPMHTLFRMVNLQKTISHRGSDDGFSLSMALCSLSGATTPPIADIKLRLLSRDGVEPRHIALSLTDAVTLQASPTEVLLETNLATKGWYVPDEVEVRIGNLRLLHHFAPSPGLDLSDQDHAAVHSTTSFPVFVYPSYHALQIGVRPSPTIHLAEQRRMLVNIKTGAQSVKRCKLRMRTATAGLRLNIHDAVLAYDGQPAMSFRTTREGDALVMIVDTLASHAVTEIQLPYSMEIQSEASVTVRVEANYDTDLGVFHLHETAHVNVLLPVSVNVQDVYRSSCMFSRFEISPSTLVPLQLCDCTLQDSPFVAVVPGKRFDEPVMVFPKQPAHWTVRLTPKPDGAAPGESRRLTLSLELQSLDDVILDVLEHNFMSQFLTTAYAFAAGVLVDHLRSHIRSAWTEQDLEVAALSQEVAIWKMADMEWSSVLSAFDNPTRAGIGAWLQSWHAQTPPLPFTSATTSRRRVLLHVEVKAPPLLLSAILTPNPPITARGTVIGRPVMVDLMLKLDKPTETDIEASFEVLAPQESWLIGGRRKGTVQLRREPFQTQIVLFPQHLGHVLLPTVIVKCRRATCNADRASGDGWSEVTCDVHNPSQAQAILVTTDVRSTTVDVLGFTPEDATRRLVAVEHRHPREERE